MTPGLRRGVELFNGGRYWDAHEVWEHEWMPDRKGAEAGSFVGRWPEMPPVLEGRAIRSRPLFSLHEGAWPPDRLEREIGAGPSADRPRGEGVRNTQSPT